MARGTTGQIPGKSCAFQFQVEKQKTREFFNVWSPNQPRRGECEFTLGGGVVDEPIGFVPRSSPTFTRARDAMMPAVSEDPGGATATPQARPAPGVTSPDGDGCKAACEKDNPAMLMMVSLMEIGTHSSFLIFCPSRLNFFPSLGKAGATGPCCCS